MVISALVLAVDRTSTAVAATQQDYDDCSQTGDLIRSMVACTRIIERQGESAPDRAGAYVQRGNDYVASGKFDEAIADYGEAIKLDPRNVTAYAARAIAYWRKGERDHAVIDYTVADGLSPKVVAEMTAGNPEIAAIRAIASPPAPLLAGINAAPTAGPFCPTHDTALHGFVLVDEAKNDRAEFRPSSGGIVWITITESGKPTGKIATYKGIPIALFGKDGDDAVFTFDPDLTKEPDPRLGYHAIMHMTVHHDGKDETTTVEDRVTTRENLRIGDCAYDAFVIEEVQTRQGVQQPNERQYFIPALGMRFIADPGKTRIEPLDR